MFWPKTVENRAALRTAIAALVAVLVSFAFHLETPYWSGMSVVVVSNLYTGSIVDKAILRIIGTIAGAFVGFYAAGLVANSFLLYFLSCFLIVAVGTYYYSLSTNGYAYLLGALCAFIIIAQLAFNPQNAFLVAIWRPVEIGIGVLVSALSAYLVFPNHLKDNINTQIQAIFTAIAVEFERFSSCLLQENPHFSSVKESNLQVKRQIRKAMELIGAMNHELGVSQERTDQIRAFLDSFYDLTRQMQYLTLLSPNKHDFALLHTLASEEVFIAIQQDLLQLKQAFAMQDAQPVVLQSEAVIKAVETRFHHQDSELKSDFVYSFFHFLQQVCKNLVLIQSLLAGVPLKTKPSFQVLKTQDRLRTDPDLIKRSVKAGLSVILALGFWLTSNWPGGINGIISSLIISIRKNLFEMKNISIHRLLGCFIGGGLALVALATVEMNLYDFILLFFTAIWVFSYFMFKMPKYAYIGLQANIALIITLAQEGGPPIDLAPPLQRLGGIVIGIIASFIVANLIWRSDIWTMLNRYLDKIYRYMEYNLEQLFKLSVHCKQLHDLANLFWLSRNLLESLADESLSAKKQQNLRQLTHRFESLVMIQATISHILVAIDLSKVHRIGHLFSLNFVLYEQKILSCFKQRDVTCSRQISDELIAFLADVERQPAYSRITKEDLRVFLAYVNALNQLTLRIF